VPSRLASQRHLVCLMSSVVLLVHDVFRKVLDHSVTVPIGVKFLITLSQCPSV